jgi:hypothetical protein
LSVAPKEDESDDRKYKLPMLAIEMVEIEAPCIINAILKVNGENQCCFLKMFEMLKEKEVLPLLAGYFGRCSLVVYRNREKEVLELVYSSSWYLELLIEHSYN